MISTIGAAVWPLIKWVVPWLGPRSGLSFAIMGAFAVASIWVYAEHREAVSEAEARVDARWEQSLDRLRKQHDREIARAMEAGDSLPPVPDKPDALERMCVQDRNCRAGKAGS